MAEQTIRELSNGAFMRFPATTPGSVIDRVIARENDKLLKADLADDTGWETAGKWGQTLARGTGEGLAQTADLPVQGLQYLFEVGKNLWEEGQGRPYERQSVASPWTDAYNEAVGEPIPGYENVNDWTAAIAPAAIESIATVGAGTGPAIAAALARQGAKRLPVVAGHVAGAAGRVAGRTAVDVGLGVAGEKAGTAAGEYLGGDIGKEIGGGLGNLLSGSVAGAAANVGKGAIKKLAFDPESEKRLRAIQRIRKETGADIPVTSGILSPKRLGTKEDTLARSLLGGGRVLETRRRQFAGIDRAKQAIAERIRGTESGGPITEASIGDDIIAMMADADATIGEKMSAIQEALETTAGELSPTDAMKVHQALKSVSDNRAFSNALREQATRLRSEISKNYEPVEPLPDIQGPPTPTMTYGATKDVRSDTGAALPEEDIRAQVQGPAYDALTEQMKETYANSGGDPDVFTQQQDEYKRLRKQQESVQKHRGTGTKTGEDTAATVPESSAYRKIVNKGGSTRQMAPYEEHAGKQLDDILADALELETRGVNAGRPIDPELVDPKTMATNWTSRPDRWKNFMTRNDPTLARMLNDVTVVSQAEAARSGKRAVPGKGGSPTFGENTLFGGKSATGAGVGAILGGLPGAVVGAVVPPAYSVLKSRLLTNETANTRLFDPEPLVSSAARAGTTANIGQQLLNEDLQFTGNVGDQATINDPQDPAYGQSGTVSEVGRGGNMYRLRMPDGSIRQMGKTWLKPTEQQ